MVLQHTPSHPLGGRLRPNWRLMLALGVTVALWAAMGAAACHL